MGAQGHLVGLTVGTNKVMEDVWKGCGCKMESEEGELIEGGKEYLAMCS